MTRVNRRRFLKAAGGGVGALAAVPLNTALSSNGAIAPQAGGRPAQGAAATANAEVVVVGAGAFGGWTALYLREMGHSVTLIDQIRSRQFTGDVGRRDRARSARCRRTRDLHALGARGSLRSLAGS